MVKAIDVRTIGLGGDSEISFAGNGALSVGPARVVPIALIGAEFPEVLALLDADLAASEGGSLLGRFVMRPLGTTRDAVGELSPREREILALVGERPRPLRKVAVSSGAQRTLLSLRRRGLVQMCGFTPSDAAHVLGLQLNWSHEAAKRAAAIAIRFRTMKAATPDLIADFAREVWSEVVRLTGIVIIDTALGEPANAPRIVDAVCAGKDRIGLARVVIAPVVPVVAVGGPVRIYYGELGRRLGAEIIFPDFFEVANAVGAATGVIAATITVTIEGDGNGLFRVYAPAGVRTFTTGGQALAAGEGAARDAAENAIRMRGAGSFDIQVGIEKSFLPDAVDDNGLLKAEIRAEAIGRPDLGRGGTLP
jgi:N-methylhydantoinase A/oxoprolinase/acetone carboxylase beta subunit